MDNFDGYIADIYREMEAELIGSMKRNLGLHEAEEALTGLKYPQWQAMKLKELRRFQRENERIMGEKLSGLPDEVSRHMIDELNQGSKHELKRYRKALKKGYKSAVVMKDSFFHINDRKVQGLINALNNDLTRANSAVLRMMNDQYRQTIFKAGMFVSNGVYTEEQAVKKAIEEFEKKGLNCIEYKDGRRVNIADYASMAVRTANQRAYMVGEGEFRKSIGETLVIISRHSTSCDLCKPFEGKVLIDDVYSGGTQEDGDYMLLSQAMEQGLYHPRCRHGLGTYYPELEDINGYETEDSRLNDYGRNVDNSGKNGIMEPRSLVTRKLPNGLRTMPSHKLTDLEIESLKRDIEAIGADEHVFKFNSGRRTGYDDVLDEIRVCGDVLPDAKSNHPRDLMSQRAALAHEYYGHRAYRGTDVPVGSWNDEFRASYMAAKNCPNLSDEDRRYLILDALERAKESGITIKYNEFIRRTLYGY